MRRRDDWPHVTVLPGYGTCRIASVCDTSRTDSSRTCRRRFLGIGARLVAVPVTSLQIKQHAKQILPDGTKQGGNTEAARVHMQGVSAASLFSSRNTVRTRELSGDYLNSVISHLSTYECVFD